MFKHVIMIIVSLQLEETIMPYLQAFATFREDVRQIARQEKGMSY